MKPRILFNDKNLTRADTDLLGLIISLTLKNDYCFATNKYLANYIDTSVRTISYSLSKFKELNYIFVKKVNGQRRIYLNKEKIPTKVADDKEADCSNSYEVDCNYNINSNYKNKYNNKIKKFKKSGIIPYWMEHPEVCKSNQASKEEIKEMEKMLKEFK